MPKFQVHLQSQTDHHARYTTLVADNEDAARAVCDAKEAQVVAFTLSDSDLAVLSVDHRIDPVTGKVHGPTSRGKAQLHAHYQEKPYLVASVTQVGE